MEAKPPRTAWSSAGMGVGGVSPLVAEVRGSIHGKKFASFTAKSCTVVNIRSANALHLSIENLEIDVLSLGFITSFLGLGVVLAHCWDVEINLMILIFPSRLLSTVGIPLPNIFLSFP